MTEIDINHSLTMSASHIIRLYIWEKLKEYMPTVWNNTDVTALLTIPIISLQELPEVQDTKSPYIVYAYDYSPTGDLWQFQEERMTLRIFSERNDVLASTTKLIVRLLNKHDESAAELNDWIGNEVDPSGSRIINPDGFGKYLVGDSEYDRWADEALNFVFKTITVPGTQGAQPADDEGSRSDSIVFVQIKYVEINMSLGSNN